MLLEHLLRLLCYAAYALFDAVWVFVIYYIYFAPYSFIGGKWRCVMEKANAISSLNFNWIISYAILFSSILSIEKCERICNEFFVLLWKFKQNAKMKWFKFRHYRTASYATAYWHRQIKQPFGKYWIIDFCNLDGANAASMFNETC